MVDPARWRAEGRTFAFHGHDIFHRASGTGGEALLCIHGIPTASWDFDRLWELLGERFAHVIAPDMLGFGFSAKPPEHRYSIAEQADLHEALLRARGVARYHLIAHDYGVTVAQELLARASASPALASVCFLNGGLFPETHRALWVQKLMLTPLGPLVARNITFELFARSFASVFGPRTQPSRDELQQFYGLVVANDGKRMFHRLFHYIPERRRHRARWVGALVEAKIPIRLIVGPADPVSGAHMVARYRELVPAPDVVELDGIGHYPHVEDPDGVLAACDAFWARVRRNA